MTLVGLLPTGISPSRLGSAVDGRRPRDVDATEDGIEGLVWGLVVEEVVEPRGILKSADSEQNIKL